jgi:cell division protein FtsB
MHTRAESHPVSQRLTVVVRWAIIFSLGVLLVSMATGQSGIANYIELTKNRDELQSIVQQLAIENQELESKLDQIRGSRETQVRYLKQEFGYVEKGEFVYLFSRSPRAKSARNQAADSTRGSLRKPKI